MKTRRNINTFAHTLLTLPLLLVCQAGQAQGLLPGFRLDKTFTNPQDISHPGIVHVADEPSIFQESFDKTWMSNKAKLDQMMESNIAYANDHGFFPKGYTLYHQKSSVATSGTLTTMLSGSDIVLSYYVPHNYLEVTTTVPSNIVGAAADPRFSFTYDLNVTMHIPISSTAQGLKVSSAVATISNVSRPDSHNLTGDLAGDIAAILRVFGQRDFIARLQAGIDGTQFPMTQQIQQFVDQVNVSMLSLSRQGYTVLTASRTKGTNIIVLRASPTRASIGVNVNKVTDLMQNYGRIGNLIHSYATVRLCNTDIPGQTKGASSAFITSLPSDLRLIPIHIDLHRELQGKSLSDLSAADQQLVKIGVVRSLDLTYDRVTGHITGSASGQLGREIAAWDTSLLGITMQFGVTDSGPRPGAAGAH